MIKNNRVSKYLIYAIGEIVLVVIGILIALQINNWNEARKQRAEEIQTLQNIRSDFKNTIAEFQENNIFRERILEATSTLYSLIHLQKPKLTKTQMDSLLATLLVNPTYNGQSETLNILFNSGKINIISNDSIKNALVIWPQQVEDITEDEIYSSNILFTQLHPIVKRHISLYDVNMQIEFKGFELFKHTRPSSISSDYEALFNDREFEGVLASRELPVSVSLIQSRDLVKTAQEIVRLIDNELDRLK